MKYRPFTRGFTLFELVTVIAVLSIIVLISTPFFSTLLRENEVYRVYPTLNAILSQSRNQAYSTHQAVALCGSMDGIGCDHNWNSGILIFLDSNQNRAFDSGEVILGYHSLNIKYGALSWRGAGGSRSKVLLFEPQRGRLNMSNGSFWYCAEQPKWHRLVILSTMGHVRKSEDKNGDGVHETASGANIRC